MVLNFLGKKDGGSMTRSQTAFWGSQTNELATRYNIDFLPLILATDELDFATEPPPGNVEQFDCLFSTIKLSRMKIPGLEASFTALVYHVSDRAVTFPEPLFL